MVVCTPRQDLLMSCLCKFIVHNNFLYHNVVTLAAMGKDRELLCCVFVCVVRHYEGLACDQGLWLFAAMS